MGLLCTFVLLSCLSSVIQKANSDLQIPGKCDFITYCARLRQYQINPTGHHPGVCPDPNICNREVQSYVRRKNMKEFNALPYEDKPGEGVAKGAQDSRPRQPTYDPKPGTCKDLAHCGRLPQRNSRPIKPNNATSDALPATCKDLLHCGRPPRYDSRPTSTAAPSDALPGGGRFPQRGGRPLVVLV